MNGRTLVIAHRRELIEQTASMLDKTGLTVGIEMADSYARSMCEPHVVVATVQTLKKSNGVVADEHFKLVMVDEAHHATAGTYRKVLDYFEHAKILGVTASPDRAGDEERIANVFPLRRPRNDAVENHDGTGAGGLFGSFVHRAIQRRHRLGRHQDDRRRLQSGRSRGGFGRSSTRSRTRSGKRLANVPRSCSRRTLGRQPRWRPLSNRSG